MKEGERPPHPSLDKDSVCPLLGAPIAKDIVHTIDDRPIGLRHEKKEDIERLFILLASFRPDIFYSTSGFCS